jgi:predicted glutamine amidotransferase
MAHLRWATMGLGVGIRNTHPFTDGHVAFAHNGSVLSPASLDPLAEPRSPGCAGAPPTASRTSWRC